MVERINEEEREQYGKKESDGRERETKAKN